MDIIGPVVDSAIPGAPNPELDCGEGDEGVLSRELGFGRTKSVGLGSSSGRRRCLPILERFASEGAERVAGNKMALNVERVMDDGVNG